MSVFKNLYVNKNLTVSDSVSIGGNLTVTGTTTAIDSANVNISDRHLYLNKDYVGAGASGGIIVNNSKIIVVDSTVVAPPSTTTITTVGSALFAPHVGRNIAITGSSAGNDGTYVIVSHIGTLLTISGGTLTASADTFTITLVVTDTVAAGGFTSATTVATTSTSNFLANDIIQINNATNNTNNGLFVVVSHTTNVLTISAVSDFAQTTFTAVAGGGATITLVNISIIQANTTGIWENIAGFNTGSATTRTILVAGGAETYATIAGTETLTNKTLTAPVINGVTTLSLDDDNSANNLILNAACTGMASDLTLNFDILNAGKTLTLGGDLTLGGALTTGGVFITSGASSLTLTTTGTTTLTLPETGTLATKALAASAALTTGTAVTAASADIQIYTITSSQVATLPAVASVTGRTFKFILRSVSAGTLTIDADAAETIEGDLTLILSVAGQHVSLTSDGVTWYVNL